MAVPKTIRAVLGVAIGVACAVAVRDGRPPQAAPSVGDEARPTLSPGATAMLDALEAAGPSSASRAFVALDDPSAEARAAAAAFLGRQGSRRAVPRLIGLLRDRDPRVRLAAAEALGAVAAPEALPFLERTVSGDDELDVAEAALAAARRIHTLEARLGSD